ncbi:MAG TPA: ester cyclase [Vicinamibacterales bacterium]|jgi:steroid delta-isomerase-like uncharacterized protein
MTREDTNVTREARIHNQGVATREDLVAFFARRQEAFDNLDASRLAADYADDCVVDSPTGGTHSGRVAAEKVLKAVFDAFLDLKVRSERLIVDGNQVAQILSIEGTDLGGFLGLPPTGKIFQLPAVFLYELNGLTIVRERRIYDFTGMLVQIGALKAKPT